MRTVIVDPPPSTAAMILGALRKRGAASAAIDALPPLIMVRSHVVLDPAPIARYARVCGFVREHGVPLTYPQMLTFPLLMALFGSTEWPWPAMGTVHLANRIAQHRRLEPGDALRVEVSCGELFAHEKGQVFTLEMRILRGADCVWEATQTFLRRGVGNPAGKPFDARLGSANGEFATPAVLSHQADFSAPGDIGRRYGKVSGDMNPIHLSVLSARLFGFRRAIAHGMWLKARALAALLPRQPLTQATVAVVFKSPLFLPARVSLWTTRETQGNMLRQASFEIRNAAGDRPHLRGQVVLDLSQQNPRDRFLIPAG